LHSEKHEEIFTKGTKVKHKKESSREKMKKESKAGKKEDKSKVHREKEAIGMVKAMKGCK